MTNTFKMELGKIQPSQLYISEDKLASIKAKITGKDFDELDPIPIKKLGDDIIFTDGHTRAFLAYQMEQSEILVEWEDENLDWEMYEICVQWCKDVEIFTIVDLEKRVVSHKKYEIVWYKRCEMMQNEINQKRIKEENNLTKKV